MAGKQANNDLMAVRSANIRTVFLDERNDIDDTISFLNGPECQAVINFANGMQQHVHDTSWMFVTFEALKQGILRARISGPQERTRRERYITETNP